MICVYPESMPISFLLPRYFIPWPRVNTWLSTLFPQAQWLVWKCELHVNQVYMTYLRQMSLSLSPSLYSLASPHLLFPSLSLSFIHSYSSSLSLFLSLIVKWNKVNLNSKKPLLRVCRGKLFYLFIYFLLRKKRELRQNHKGKGNKRQMALWHCLNLLTHLNNHPSNFQILEPIYKIPL